MDPGRLRIAVCTEPWNGWPVDAACKEAVAAAGSGTALGGAPTAAALILSVAVVAPIRLRRGLEEPEEMSGEIQIAARLCLLRKRRSTVRFCPSVWPSPAKPSRNARLTCGGGMGWPATIEIGSLLLSHPILQIFPVCCAPAASGAGRSAIAPATKTRRSITRSLRPPYPSP